VLSEGLLQPVLDTSLQSSNTCPSCKLPAVDADGSTGGCGEEQQFRPIDHHSAGLQGVLWRVYSNLRVRCGKHPCEWVGDFKAYEQHVRECKHHWGIASQANHHSSMAHHEPSRAKVRCLDIAMLTDRFKVSVSSESLVRDVGAKLREMGKVESVMAASFFREDGHRVEDDWPVNVLEEGTVLCCVCKASNHAEVVGRDHLVAREHQASDDSQLSLQIGDKVTVQKESGHGWVYGSKVAPDGRTGQPLSGWFPAFCLPEDRPPPPVQTPPPMAPPKGSRRIARDYEASDAAQLTVKEKELVIVRQREASGWTFVVRTGTQGAGQREGWIPEWCLGPQESVEH